MNNISIILEQARLLLDQGRSRDAEIKIRQALEQDPQNDVALSMLARCYFNYKQYDEGISTITRAISREPEESFYFYLLGYGHYQKDNAFEATANLHKAIQLNPYNSEYYGLLAFVLVAGKKWEEGLDIANQGLALDAKSITCLNARSMALNKLKRVNDAIATMENALAQDPDNEFTHTTVGWNLLERGKHKEAAKHFREALRIDPMRQNAQSGLKEALKSKIPPYKWLLQYSFWVNNKGRKLQRFMPIALFIIFRILITVFKNSQSTAPIAWALAGIYLFFVIGSWTMNSVANFFLLFHRDGKYALTNTEKWSAITVVSSLAGCFIIVVLAFLTPVVKGTIYEENIIIPALVCLSLALPFGEIKYPFAIRNTSARNIFSLLLILVGLISLTAFPFFPSAAVTVMAIYGIGFILYNWSGVFRK